MIETSQETLIPNRTARVQWESIRLKQDRVDTGYLPRVQWESMKRLPLDSEAKINKSGEQ